MDLTNLLPIIVVALLTLIGNIFYFEYKFRKEGRKEILKQKLVNLLLPLYFILKKDELEFHEWLKSDADIYEYHSDMPKRLVSEELYKTISNNLYLADEELHNACLLFLEWGYKSDPHDRFQRIHNSELIEDVVFKEFRKMVYSKFYAVRKAYLEE